MKKVHLFIFLCLALSTSKGFAQKTDTLFHINGNILLGEIKKLNYGILDFKMDGMGTIKVQIEKIKSLKSTKFFEFTTDFGRHIYGAIDSSAVSGVININTGYDSVNIHIYQIVELYPIKNTFTKRLSGKLGAGFNYTKASNVARYNIDLNLSYRNKGTFLSLTSSTLNTFNPGDSILASSKYDGQLDLQKQWLGKLSWTSFIGTSHNTELGLDLRANFGLGLMWNALYTKSQRLYWIIAITPNTELATQNTEQTVNVEARANMSYELFKHTDPEISLNTSANLYPSLSDLGRYRADYNFNANFELFNNFYLGGTFYYTFDSNPVSESASREDFGFTTTIGYSFH